MEFMKVTGAVRPLLVLTISAIALAACGGGGGGNRVNGGGGGGGGGSGSGWSPGVFQSSTSFEARCANPRGPGAPNGPWPDVQGTVTNENNFLRSYSNETYLWYDEIPDRDPGLFADPLLYFEGLVTTVPGKDNFHFTVDTNDWIAQSQSGVSAGYGALFAILQGAPPRQVVVAFTDPDTPAADNGLARGAELITLDGVDVVNGGTQADVDALIAGLFPGPGESHTFGVRDLGSNTTRTFTMVSENVTATPVQNAGPIPGHAGVGYLLFNDHIATAEAGLVDAITALAAANVTDLVIDVRYNGGGFLYIASELAYMIAGPGPTAGATFELQQFNDKHPSVNPVTGQTIQPLPFYDTDTQDDPLPTLNLDRVFVLTGSGTCSASEAIINGLRGVDVDVIQVGSTTCGKPYGFYATDNCGTTYFTIQFRGVNDKNYGDYTNGFSPSPAGTIDGNVVPGCAVGDDFTAALGDPAEARLSAALFYRDTGACPVASPATAPATARLRLDSDQAIVTPKMPWRNMRILSRP